MFSRVIRRQLVAPSLRGRGLGHHAPSSPPSTPVPSLINLTFIDEDGTRANVAARVGATLLETIHSHRIEILSPCEGGGAPRQTRKTDKFVEDSFGAGPDCFFCHVKIPTRYQNGIEPLSEYQTHRFEEAWENEFSASTSRLACQIVLAPEHDGMVVFVPDPPATGIVDEV